MTRLREVLALQANQRPWQRFLLCIGSRHNMSRISAVVWKAAAALVSAQLCLYDREGFTQRYRAFLLVIQLNMNYGSPLVLQRHA